MVTYARSLCEDVEFSAEDALRSDPEFLYEVYSVAVEAVRKEGREGGRGGWGVGLKLKMPCGLILNSIVKFARWRWKR